MTVTDHERDAHDDEGPCLELEAGPAPRGTLFPLGVDAQIGNVITARVPLRMPELRARHARVFRFEGAYFIQDVQGQGTTVNGTNIGREAHALDDGDRIVLQHGAATLRFRKARPPLSGVEQHGAWATFAPWCDDPELAYAINAQGYIRTAAFARNIEVFTTATSEARATELQRGGGEGGKSYVVIYDADLAGVRWPDLLWRTSEQRAALDGRTLFAAASLMMRGGDARQSRMHVTWNGVLAWYTRPEVIAPLPTVQDGPRLRQTPPLGPVQRENARVRFVLHRMLIAAGCSRARNHNPYVEESDEDVLLAHRAALPNLPLDDDVRSALSRLIDVALKKPKELTSAMEHERAALGDVAPADLAGLVAHLFPKEHARHRRIVEEAHVLGVAGVLALRS